MKAVLVMEMPKNCDECLIRFSGEPNEWCWYLRHGLDDIKAKPSWCPLRPLPRKLDYRDLKWCNQDNIEGWNDCLEEIVENINDGLRRCMGETE